MLYGYIITPKAKIENSDGNDQVCYSSTARIYIHTQNIRSVKASHKVQNRYDM